MPSNLYLFVEYVMTQGECSCGCQKVVCIVGGQFLSQDQIQKILVNQVVKAEFGDDTKVDKDNPCLVWEDTEERWAELRDWRKISLTHFNILKIYLFSDTLKLEKETFTFR